jgi:hypothetical protein
MNIICYSGLMRILFITLVKQGEEHKAPENAGD